MKAGKRENERAQSARRGRLFCFLAFSFCAFPLYGCAVLNPGHAPGESLTFREPDTRREYRLYVPSTYSANRAWPLVVACHGEWPLDGAGSQIDEWKALAEEKGFLVAAPELVSSAGGSSSDPSARVTKERQDEEAILRIVAHIRGARNVDANSIFLYGWLGGAFPALFAGLKNPDVFRAVSLRQPSFNAACLAPCLPYLDRQQPVQVIYGFSDISDFTRPQGLACVEWLRQNRMNVFEEETPSAHQREPQAVYGFIHRVVRTMPWIRVTVTEADVARPLAVRFSLQSSVPIDLYLWEFGDGQQSRIASPEHTYATPGTYTIRATVTSGKKSYTRNLEIRVPRTRLGTTQPDRR